VQVAEYGSAPAGTQVGMQGVRRKVWDIPTRIVHWLLVGLVALSWWTAENNRLDIHRWSGYSIFALVLFRVLWGFAGGTTARFGTFVRGPRAVAAYAKEHLFGRSHVTAGHNPMGGWSIVAMLAVLATQIGTGLFSVDVDGIESGPLSYLVSFDSGRALAKVHHLSFNVLLGLIALHLAAVLFYCLYKREALISAMILGVKKLPHAHTELHFAPWWRLLVAAVVAVLIVAAVVATEG
jgi:cytochrome b